MKKNYRENFKRILGSIFRKKMFMRFIFSYALIIIIPMSVIWLVYYESSTIVGSQTNENSRAIIKQLKQAVDSELQLIRSESILFALDPRMMRIISSDKPLQSLKDNEYLSNLRSVLNGISITSSMAQAIKVCYIYMENSETVITPSGIYESRMFFDQNHSISGFSYEEWIQLLAGSSGKFIVLPDLNASSIAYVNQVNNQNETKACVVTMLDSKQLRNIFRDFETISAGRIGINDMNGNSLLFTEESASFKIDGLKDYYGNFYYKDMRNGNSKVIFTESINPGWFYTASIPLSKLGLQNNFLKNLAVTSSVISLVFCFIIAYFLARYNYRPFKTIFNMLREKSGVLEPGEADELNYIQKATNSVLNERLYLKDSLQLQKRNLTNLYLERLLKGNYLNYQSIEESILSTDIRISSDAFAVLLVKSEVSADAASGGELYDENLKRLKMLERIDKSIDRTHNCYLLNTEESVVCLVNFRDGNVNDYRDYMCRLAKTCRGVAGELPEVCPAVVVSDIHYTYWGISQAYEEALNIMSVLPEHCEPGQVITGWDVFSSENNSFMNSYIKEKEQKFLNLLVNGAEKQACSELEAIYMKSKEHMSHTYMKFLLLDMSFTCLKAVYLSPINSLEDMDGLKDILKKIQSCATSSEMKSGLIELISLVCAAVTRELNSTVNMALRDRVAAIVSQNYADNNLCLASIASSLNMNSNYISSLYKKQTGETVLEAISRVRMNKAKELLKKTKHPISEIAEAVGYNNSLSFLRTFKKNEGLTPAQYREVIAAQHKY